MCACVDEYGIVLCSHIELPQYRLHTGPNAMDIQGGLNNVNSDREGVDILRSLICSTLSTRYLHTTTSYCLMAS